MENLPVFASSDEYRLWKVLNGKVPENRLESITAKILSSDGFIHPAILTSLMDALSKDQKKVPIDTLISLASKSRPQDSSPTVRATEILIDQGETKAAAELLSRNKSKDRFSIYLAEAKLYHGEGDKYKSVESAKKALDIDPANREIYSILKEDDPYGPWEDMESVYDAREQLESKTPVDEKYKELYLIYKNWHRGNKDSATNRLINSEHYKNGEWEFLLVSARTSADEDDWRSAKMVYDKIGSKAPTYVRLEAAEAFIAGHEPDEALNIYDELDLSIVRVLQGRIMAYAHMGSEKDLMNAIYDYLDNENSGSQDYSEIIDMLVNNGSLEDAKYLLNRMSHSNKKDPNYLVSKSKYLLKRGDVRGASKTARTAVLFAKNEPSVRVLAARMRFINNDVKGAEKECDKLLSEDPKYFEALVLKKDIMVSRQDIQGALEICRRILDIEPNDIPTMFTLSTALSGTGDMSGAMMTLRNVLRLEPSRENVLNVVGSMIVEGMYREAMFLCYDLERDTAPDPMIRRLRGNAEYALGEYMKASVSYAAAAELAPHDPVIWHSKGMADEARGDLDSAEASYNRAVTLDLNESQYWISKASIQEKMEDLYGAIDSLNRAIELDPDSIYAMVRKAVILEKSGKYKEALYFVDMCAVSEPSNADVALMKARILRESGAAESALKKAKDVYDKTKSEESALEVASCCLALRKRAEALDVVSEALTKYPDSARLRVAMDSIHEGSAELEDQSETLPETAEEDPAAIKAIAESMMAMGDYRSALRQIDRAISLEGDDVSYICLKAEILIRLGEFSNSQNLVTDALKDNPKSGVLHESLGDVKMAKSEYRGALQEYEKAITLGLNLPSVLAKKGDAQQGLGYYDRSIDSYTMAVARDTENVPLHYELAFKLYERGYMARAEKEAKEILDQAPDDARTIILFAKIERESRKDLGILDAYKMFKASNIKDKDAIREMVEVLNSAGHDEEARNLIRDEPEKFEDTRIKRSAEKVLRRAYVSRTAPDDEDLLLSLGFEGGDLTEIQEYIRKEAPYGEIVPGSPEFQKMEHASNDIIMRMGWKDLETKPKLPLDRVYVSGSFKDVDEAKRLISYIYKAMNAKVIRDESMKIVLDRVQGTSIYEIMKACKVGVYQARQIQLLTGVDQ